MNRERILLAAVVGIVALYVGALRDPARPEREQRPGSQDAVLREVLGTEARSIVLGDSRAFIEFSTRRPHPREELPLPRSVELPNLWPPTSMTVELQRQGLLRRATAAPSGAPASVALPALPTEGGASGGADSGPRVDTWTTNNNVGARQSGQVQTIFKGRVALRASAQLGYGAAAGEFEKLLCLLEVDPAQAAGLGVTSLELKFKVGAVNRMNFPSEAQGFQVCETGKERAYFDAFKDYLRLPPQSYGDRRNKGAELLQRGKASGDRHALEWAFVMLTEARDLVPGQNPTALREILQLALEVSNRLNRQELVLQLAFEFLGQFPGDDQVLAYVGGLLDSRSFGLSRQAEAWYAQARQNADAQRARATILMGLGRYEEAKSILERRVAGSGPEVDLLDARLSLATGDLVRAEERARGHSSGSFASLANQILGCVEYARGRPAQAEALFLRAAQLDPSRSTAFSDLGMALAVQGKDADARACFDRALQLDSIYNAVAPELGRAFLKLAAQDVAGALDTLRTLEEGNPNDVWVRYLHAYALERSGRAPDAATMYAAILNDNHRCRFVIARLGLVRARLAEEAGAGGEEAITEAVVNLQKAVELNPADAPLSYILARFLLWTHEDDRAADALFDAVAKLAAPSQEPDLPTWAQCGRAVVTYRDPEREESKAIGAFQSVLEAIKRLPQYSRPGGSAEAEKHPAFVYADTCLKLIQETLLKEVEEWTFAQTPRDWVRSARDPMKITARRDPPRAEFQGEVSLQGSPRNPDTVLQFCSLQYKDQVVGANVYKAVFEGELPENPGAEFGVGVVGASGQKTGPAGIQVRYDRRDGTVAVRLEGGDSETFKRIDQYVLLGSVRWKPGRFKITIEVTDREQGLIRVWLEDGSGASTNLFEAGGIGRDSERCALFGRGRSSRPLSLVAWVEGNEGERFEKIFLDKVSLVKRK